jgi:hypothetical protein
MPRTIRQPLVRPWPKRLAGSRDLCMFSVPQTLDRPTPASTSISHSSGMTGEGLIGFLRDLRVGSLVGTLREQHSEADYKAQRLPLAVTHTVGNEGYRACSQRWGLRDNTESTTALRSFRNPRSAFTLSGCRRRTQFSCPPSQQQSSATRKTQRPKSNPPPYGDISCQKRHSDTIHPRMARMREVEVGAPGHTGDR